MLAQLHPLLDVGLGGQCPLLFNLSSPSYDPRRNMSVGPSGYHPLSENELNQPATSPYVMRAKIICDDLPGWSITVKPSGYSVLTVNDVLTAIHRAMQRQITQPEWDKLSKESAAAVARAYKHRCRAQGADEEKRGVKRVDYLRDQYMFKGLTYSGFEHLVLVVRDRVEKAVTASLAPPQVVATSQVEVMTGAVVEALQSITIGTSSRRY